MNLNTVASLSGGTLRGQIPAQAGIGTTETVFVQNTDTGTAVAVLAPNVGQIIGSFSPLDQNINAAKIGAARSIHLDGATRPYISPATFDNGMPFTIRLAGTFTSAVAANDLKISLYLGSSATLGSDSVITAALTTGTTGNFGAVSGQFLLEVRMFWDSTSGKLNGLVENAMIAPAGVTPTFIAPAAVTQTAAAAATNLQFVATAKWNVSNAGNTVQVREFSIDLG